MILERWMAGAAVAAGLAGGCALSGEGSGILSAPVTTTGAQLTNAELQLEGPVAFAWKTDGAVANRGTIIARLPDGRVFTGVYVEPTKTTRNAEEWVPFECETFGCTSGSMQTMTTTFSGVLDANLTDGASTRMACRFVLARPPAGPAGGGTGRCVLSNGEQVESAELHRGLGP